MDFPRAAFGFQSDEATYYMMAHSLAADGDLEYRRADLVRVWREFPSGPSGVFLKLGRTVRARVNAAFPFLHVSYGPDPDKQRLYYGKSFMYPLVAAPFVWLFGTNGFLLLHALLLALVVAAGYVFLAARSPSPVALVLASGFFLASVDARLSGVDDARAIQSGDGDAGVLLLVVQASAPGARRFAASDGFRQGPPM